MPVIAEHCQVRLCFSWKLSRRQKNKCCHSHHALLMSSAFRCVPLCRPRPRLIWRCVNSVWMLSVPCCLSPSDEQSCLWACDNTTPGGSGFGCLSVCLSRYLCCSIRRKQHPGCTGCPVRLIIIRGTFFLGRTGFWTANLLRLIPWLLVSLLMLGGKSLHHYLQGLI